VLQGQSPTLNSRRTIGVESSTARGIRCARVRGGGSVLAAIWRWCATAPAPAAVPLLHPPAGFARELNPAPNATATELARAPVAAPRPPPLAAFAGCSISGFDFVLVEASMNQMAGNKMRLYDLPSKLLCRVLNVELKVPPLPAAGRCW